MEKKNLDNFIECDECNGKISNKAIICPHCGVKTKYKMKQEQKIKDFIIIPFAILLSISTFILIVFLDSEEVDYLDGEWQSYGDKVSSDINKKIIYDTRTYIKYRFNANKTCSVIFYDNGKEINAVNHNETPTNNAIYETCTYNIKDDNIRIDFEDGSGDDYTFSKDGDTIYIDDFVYEKVSD